MPRFNVDHRHPGVERPEVEVGDVGHLYGVVDDVDAGAAVPLLEHRLVDDHRRFDVLGGLPHVPLDLEIGTGQKARMDVLIEAPLHRAGVRTSLVGLRPRFEYHVRMFLLKNRKAVQSHWVHGKVNEFVLFPAGRPERKTGRFCIMTESLSLRN